MASCCEDKHTIMWEAVFADVGVALLVILKAVRIQHMKFD